MDREIMIELELEVLTRLQRARTSAQILLADLYEECKGTYAEQLHDALQCIEESRFIAEQELARILEEGEKK